MLYLFSWSDQKYIHYTEIEIHNTEKHQFQITGDTFQQLFEIKLAVTSDIEHSC